jgi:site-specific recombinase XerD
LQKGKGHAPSTINRRIQALRKFYSFAVSQGWTLTNPAEDVPLLSEVVSQRSRFLSSEDIAHLLAVVKRSDGRWSDRDWSIVQVLIGAGLKVSELIELRLSDVHLDDDQPLLAIRGASDGSGRTVALEADVCDALREYLSTREAVTGVDHVFVNRDGQPLSTRSIQRLVHQYGRAAGLDRLTTQALRYVYARRVYKKSGDLRTVARLLGHRHLATTIRYLRPGPSQGK